MDNKMEKKECNMVLVCNKQCSHAYPHEYDNRYCNESCPYVSGTKCIDMVKF